jgi:hypothetical protein
MADFGLSAFAMFFMQSASFLSFQRRLEKGHGRSNCQTLFGIERIPSDNYIRDMLDDAAPSLLAPCFERTEQLLLEPAMRQAFGRLGGRTLVALDGSEYFCSYRINCPHCLTRKRSNGKIESYHSLLAATVVAPGHSKVVPLMPEFIVKQDGAEKQDCERNAVKRWHEKHGARLKPLRPVYLADDLFACQSVVQRLIAGDGDFIFTCKETSHRALYDFIEGCEFERREIKIRKGKTSETHRYRFIEKVPLRDGEDAVLVNWIGFEILDAKGVVKYKTAFRHLAAGNQGQCRRRRRLRSREVEDRERKLQRAQEPRLRTRAQLRPRREFSGHDARRAQLARFRLAHAARSPGAALATRPRSRGKAKELFQLPRHHHELRHFPRMVRPPPSPRHFHRSAPPPRKAKNRMKAATTNTFRIAG